jgi:hypothetical protein
MIGCGQRPAGPVHAEIPQQKVLLVIEVIEMKNGKNSRIGTPVPQKRLRLRGFENFSHESRGQATRPLIEIPDYNSRSGPLLFAEHVITQQHSRLMPSLHKARAQVHVEEV